MASYPQLIATFIVGLLLLPVPLLAQDGQFEAGGQIAIAGGGPFDDSDIGIGARFGWRPSGLFGVEAEFNVYPSDLPGEVLAFTSSRVEALFGATIGPRLGSIRPFGRVRPGLLRYQEAPAPVICILIFPPPLNCQLAAGQTLFALDVGGGVEVNLGRTMLLRIDVGDRMAWYPDPYEVGHDLRVAAGWAFRF